MRFTIQEGLFLSMLGLAFWVGVQANSIEANAHVIAELKSEHGIMGNQILDIQIKMAKDITQIKERLGIHSKEE